MKAKRALHRGGMARLLLAVMLMVLSTQLVWSAAARYCGHEAGRSHPGHHSHQHVADGPDAADADRQADDGPGALGDFDCEFCHGFALQNPCVPAGPALAARSESYALAETVRAGTQRCDEIERPKWQRAAQTGAAASSRLSLFG